MTCWPLIGLLFSSMALRWFQVSYAYANAALASGLCHLRPHDDPIGSLRMSRNFSDFFLLSFLFLLVVVIIVIVIFVILVKS